MFLSNVLCNEFALLLSLQEPIYPAVTLRKPVETKKQQDTVNIWVQNCEGTAAVKWLSADKHITWTISWRLKRQKIKEKS